MLLLILHHHVHKDLWDQIKNVQDGPRCGKLVWASKPTTLTPKPALVQTQSTSALIENSPGFTLW